MTIRLRPATLDDARILLEWRNDPVTRESSFSTAEVAWEDHVRWLGRRIAEGGLWIADGVGTVRVDPDGELSITVAPEVRGQGHAAPLLEAAVRAAADLGIARVTGRVKAANAASRRAFERAGFAIAEQDDDEIRFVRETA